MDILSPPLVADPLRSDMDWAAWHVFWADERCVPWSSPDSNYGLANRLLFERVGIPREQIYAVNGSLGPAESADAYTAALAEVLGDEKGRIPVLDVILLGVGEDGHTASLFPNHSLLKETQQWAAPVFDAPKPPPARVTLTLPVINQARHVFFVAAGEGKKSILSQIFGPGFHQSQLPAALVHPVSGDLQWFMDEAAGGHLKNSRFFTFIRNATIGIDSETEITEGIFIGSGEKE